MRIKKLSDINNLVYQEKGKIQEKELFTSSYYSEYLWNLVKGIAERFLGSVNVIENVPYIACTNSRDVKIGYDNVLAKKADSIVKKHKVYCGLTLHEVGHLLFTNFEAQEDTVIKMIKGKYPISPSLFKELGVNVEVHNKIMDFFLKKGAITVPVSIFQQLFNCIEDGFVDRAMMLLIPGYGKSLVLVREIDESLSCQTYQDLNGCSNQHKFVSLLLSLSRHDKICFDEQTDDDDVIAAFKKAIPVIRRAVNETNSKQRLVISYAVFALLLELLAKDKVSQQQQDEVSADDENETAEGNSSEETNSSTSQNSDNNSADENSEPNTDETEDTESTSDAKDTSSGKKTGSEENSESNEDSSSSSEENSNTTEDGNMSNNESSANEDEAGQTSSSKEGENSQEETGAPKEDTAAAEEKSDSNANAADESSNPSYEDAVDSVMSDIESALNDLCSNMPKSEKTERKGQKQQKPADDLAKDLFDGKSMDEISKQMQDLEESINNESITEDSDLSSICEEIAHEKVAEIMEQDIAEENKEYVDKVALANIHRKVENTFKRIAPTEAGKNQYQQEKPELENIVRRFIKDFQREIKERQLGDTTYGLYMGKRVSSRDVYRYDKRIFSRKIAPEDIPDMAVGILIDCSGSMYWDKKLEIAKRCAYITYSFCKKLEIPCFIVGHTTNGDNVVLYDVAEPKSLDGKDCERIFSLSAGNCNRDGYALRYCMEKLDAMVASTKIMCVISDGQPNHYGYGEVAGRQDVQECVKEFIKKGIVTITAGIGEDALSVKSIYTKDASPRACAQFLDITDLEKMPKAFIKIIKNYLQ